MRAALALLLALASPALARPAGFVDAAEVVPGLVVEMRYHGADNFVGRPIDGYERSLCLLTREAAAALAAVQADLAPQGLGLKVFDCYRPARAVADFLRWAEDPDDVRRKAEHYPGLDKPDLFRLGYISARSAHSRGSTVDLTLVDRGSGRPLDMGSPFDLFSPRSATRSPEIGARARANRLILRAAMERRGFRPYAVEWWHFTLQDEPHPERIFDDPVR
jgi:D-alanyl-D-alanine dipeptidase